MMEQLTTLRQRAAFQQERILEIDKELLQFGRQTMLLHRLYSAGHMDAVHYYTQSQSLNGQVNALRRERRQLIEDDRDDEMIEQITLLSDILKAGPEKVGEFDSEIFRGIVRGINITEPGSARFALINGLEVMEPL